MEVLGRVDGGTSQAIIEENSEMTLSRIKMKNCLARLWKFSRVILETISGNYLTQIVQTSGQNNQEQEATGKKYLNNSNLKYWILECTKNQWITI